MRDPACPFCAIVADEAPAHVVLRDDVGVAFLDQRPVFKGHVLWVPHDHIETLADLPVERSVRSSSAASGWRPRWSAASGAPDRSWRSTTG